MPNDARPPGGRKPPPPEYRFLKGKSGNERGRPRGSMSLSKAAAKVGLKVMTIFYGGKKITQTMLEHTLEALRREAARGVPSMINEFARVQSKLVPAPEEQRGGFLVVPETLTHAEAMEQMRKHNALHTRDPSLPWEPDPEAEARAAAMRLKRAPVLAELEKARMGLPSALGEAMLAYERKWGDSYNPVADQ